MLVYDVTNAASLAYLETLSGTLHGALHAKSLTTTTPTKKRSAFPFVSSSPSRKDAAAAAAASARPYHFLLVGTKIDTLPSAREVSWLEGQHAAGELLGPDGAIFLEVSARSGQGVGTVFPLLGRAILRGRRERKQEEEEEAEARRQLQRPRRKRGASEGGAFGGGGGAAGCECEYSDFCVDDDDHDDCDDGDGDTDACDCADGGGTLRRRWAALKTTLSGSLFRKEYGS